MDKLRTPLTTELERIMSDRFGRYSKYIIQERALPDVRDGLKPVQRRILYAMFNDGNTFEKGYRKSAKTVGLVIGNYHPHGDSSVYDAMVRMSQSWKMNHLLVDMQGNNGSIDDDPAAAMRYTEARLSNYGQALLTNIEENTIAFTPNFDDTSLEPSVLPAGIPNLLINGASGIAAGYATNIPPHSLHEIIEGTIYRLNHPTSSLDDLLPLIQGPDFPTGGIVQGKKGILDAFRTGKGRIVIRAKAVIQQTKTIQQIIITEIPYEVVKSNLVKRMDEIRINKQLDALLDVRDESDRNGLRIVLDLKKESDASMVLNYLYKNTDCQVYYTYNMVSIIEKRPILTGLIEMIDAFISFRKDLVLRRSQFQADSIAKRMHILEGLIKAISVLDEVITLIRSSKDKGDAKANLIERFTFTEVQAEAIVNLRLYRLTNTDIVEIKNELAELQHEFQTLQGILKSPELLKNVLVKELQAYIQQFKVERRSRIEEDVEEIVIDRRSMIPNEKTMITLSRDGYFKRVSMRSYQSSENSPTLIKEGDQLIGALEAETYDHVLLFTDKGSYANLPLLDVEESKWKELGNHVGHYVKSEDHERFIAGFVVKRFEGSASIVSITKEGLIKRSPLKDFEVSRTTKMYDAISLRDHDEVIETLVAYPQDSIVLVSHEGFAVHYALEDIPEVFTKSKGVKSMNLSKGDYVVSASLLNDEKTSILVVANTGQMKRIKKGDFNQNNRPAKGELIARKIKTNPVYVEKIKAVNGYESLDFSHDLNHRLSVSDVPLMDKTAGFNQGLKDQADWYWLRQLEEIKVVESISSEPNQVKQEKVTALDSKSDDVRLIKGSEGLPQEVNSDNQDPNDIEFIHFDL